MVAKSAIITNRMNSLPNPILVRETVQKVERCMARLQELQFTAAGGLKLSHRISCFRSKQESLRIKNAASQRSPTLKIQEREEVHEWQKKSLTAMLLNETLAEILQASKLVTKITAMGAAIDPRTPDTGCRKRKPWFENTELRERRANEKQLSSRTHRSEYGSPVLRRARTRISFKMTSPLSKKEAVEIPTARTSVSANRILPKNRAWTKKTVVLFPNQLFASASPLSTAAQPNKFFKTRSPIIGRASQIPHKFLIKSPSATLGSQFRSKRAVPKVTVSPSKGKVSTSMPRRCSFSPIKFTNKLASPLKARLSFHKVGVGGLMAGMMKQRPSFSTAMKVPSIRSK